MPAERTHLAAMSREDGAFLEPHRDFPVIVGDTGNWGYSEEVRRMRTPASVEESEEAQLQEALRWELADLEARQSEQAQATYRKYAHQFSSISERIYFLKLPYHERYSYLESRGIVSSPSYANYFQPSSGTISLGMSKEEVLSAFGRPQRVEIAGNPRFENERWLYAQQGSKQYVYFESGKVGGWE